MRLQAGSHLTHADAATPLITKGTKTAMITKKNR